MNHDELLNKLNFVWSVDEPQLNKAEQLRLALSAVVELHKPERISIPCPDSKPGCCALHYGNRFKCTCGAYNYPCPTIQAIEKELK